MIWGVGSWEVSGVGSWEVSGVGGWVISDWPVTVEKEPDATTSKPAVKEPFPEEIVFLPNDTAPLPDGQLLPLPSTERDGDPYEHLGFIFPIINAVDMIKL